MDTHEVGVYSISTADGAENVDSGAGKHRRPPVSTEDEDVRLARVLQQQEQFLYALSGAVDPYAGYYEEEAPDEHHDAPLGMTAGGMEEEGPISDEEFARRLQAEEDQETYRQLSALQAQAHGHGLQDLDVDDEQFQDHAEGLDYAGLQALSDVVGTVSKGLPPAVVSALPVCSFALLDARGTAVLDKCCVCQESYEPADQVKVLPCTGPHKHYFHVDCISEWLTLNKVCPVCNSEIPTSATAQAGH